MTLPVAIEEVDSAWMSSQLGFRVSVVAVERVAKDSAFAAQLFRIQVRRHDNGINSGATHFSVIVKLPIAADGATRQILDGFHAYEREVTFYRDVVGNRAPVRTPRPLIALHDAGTHDFVLVLEDLAPLEAADQLTGLTVEQAESVVDALAQFHSWAWENENLGRVATTLPLIDAPDSRPHHELFGQVFAQAWPAVSARLGEHVAPEVGEMCCRFPALIHYFAQELGSPTTIAHGELRSDNLFLTGNGGGPYLIDFQAATRGCGMIDVAYLVTSSVPSELRRGADAGLVQRYVNVLSDHGVRGYTSEKACVSTVSVPCSVSSTRCWPRPGGRSPAPVADACSMRWCAAPRRRLRRSTLSTSFPESPRPMNLL